MSHTHRRRQRERIGRDLPFMRSQIDLISISKIPLLQTWQGSKSPLASVRARLGLKKTANTQDAHLDTTMVFDTLPLDKSQLNPIGRRSVKTYFLDTGVNPLLTSRVDSASLGFLVSGSHADGHHTVQRDRFHDAFRIGRRGCKDSRENYDLRQDIFGLICDTVSPPSFHLLTMLITRRPALWTA